jgi:hypothetical protein
VSHLEAPSDDDLEYLATNWRELIPDRDALGTYLDAS